MSAYRILIVDDDSFFLQVYSDFLSNRGFEVDTAATGEQAIKKYRPGKYELVIVDLVMPGLGGIDLVAEIRSVRPTQDILVVTGTDDVRVAVRAMRLGVYDYLVKPIEREELLHVIDRLQERATLYDEHSRLASDNLQYAEMQQVFQKGLSLLDSFDFEQVCEQSLEATAEVTGAQGAMLWLARDSVNEVSIHGFRGLIDASAAPMAWNPEGSEFSRELRAGIPVPSGPALGAVRGHEVPSPSLFVPLSSEGRVEGVIQLVDKLGGGFDLRDALLVRPVAQAATAAVLHAKHFRQLERVGLRDASSAAYNMTFFVDHLGRELHKARRYRRSFTLIEVKIDNMATLGESLGDEVKAEVLRQLTEALSGTLSDIDILAKVGPAELFLLLPETDLLRGLALVRAARNAISRNEYLSRIDREHPIQVSFGPASFPRDGDDVDQLFAACRRRLEEAQRSLFRRLHLEDVSFWDAVDLLIGRDEFYAGDTVSDERAFRVTEDSRGLSRHAIFPAGADWSLRRDIVSEARRQGGASGWLFLAGDWRGADDSLVAGLSALEGSALRTYLLGQHETSWLRRGGNIVQVGTDAKAFSGREVILMLAEHSAYGLLGKSRADGRLYGFHTADWTLVEGLIDKLQDSLSLQKGPT